MSTTMHPNTKAMLQAWRRMTANPEDLNGGPSAQDYPGLLGRLFVLQGARNGQLPVRIAGDALPTILGRNLIGTDFLDLWADTDHALLTALVGKVLEQDRPGLVRAFGETRSGQRVEVEVTFAPLGKTSASQGRLLGLYQTLGGESLLGEKPIFTHRLRSLYPPEPRRSETKLRLVAQND